MQKGVQNRNHRKQPERPEIREARNAGYIIPKSLQCESNFTGAQKFDFYG